MLFLVSGEGSYNTIRLMFIETTKGSTYNIINSCTSGPRRAHLDSSLHVHVGDPLVQMQFKSLHGTDCINGDDPVVNRVNGATMCDKAQLINRYNRNETLRTGHNKSTGNDGNNSIDKYSIPVYYCVNKFTAKEALLDVTYA